MKVKEVEYGRLFNLENYQNERIAFRVAVDDNEDADAVVGQLFFKVLKIEEALQLYRAYLELIERTKREVRDYERSIESNYEDLAEYENRKKRLLEEEDSKAKMCQLLDLDEMIARTKERIEELKKKRDSALTRLKVLRERKDEITGLIKAGKFEEVVSSEASEVEEADA